MQKVVNIIAIASGVVSIAVVGSVGYVYINKDAIIDSVKTQALEAVMGGMGAGALGGAALPSLPTGANDLAPSAPDQASAGPGLPTMPSF